MPLLTAVFGVGLIVAGVFPADPSLGFPPGTPPGTPEDLSLHASLHGLGFLLAFGSVAVACLISARRDLARGDRLWAAYGIVTALVAVGLSMWPGQTGASIRYFVAAVIVWAWTTLTAARLLRESANERSPMRGERDAEDHRRHVRVA